jgi:hypothetical protein
VDITPVDEPNSEGITRFHCERMGWLRKINYTTEEEKEEDGEQFKFDVKLNADGNSFSIQSYKFVEDRYGGHFELTGDYPAVPIATNTIIE